MRDLNPGLVPAHGGHIHDTIMPSNLEMRWGYVAELHWNYLIFSHWRTDLARLVGWIHFKACTNFISYFRNVHPRGIKDACHHCWMRWGASFLAAWTWFLSDNFNLRLKVKKKIGRRHTVSGFENHCDKGVTLISITGPFWFSTPGSLQGPSLLAFPHNE